MEELPSYFRREWTAAQTEGRQPGAEDTSFRKNISRNRAQLRPVCRGQPPGTDDGRLAIYIKLFFRHWNQSRNLVQPEPAQYDGKITLDEVGSLVDAIEEKNAWVQLEQRYPEYQLTSISYVRNAVNKGVYIHFEMRRRWGR